MSGAWRTAARKMLERSARCGYCLRAPAVELDHRVPLSQGGSHDPQVNSVPACRRCHDEKSKRERRRPA